MSRTRRKLVGSKLVLLVGEEQSRDNTVAMSDCHDCGCQRSTNRPKRSRDESDPQRNVKGWCVADNHGAPEMGQRS
ncbi:hypothetical protein HA466_0196470 [Hirschfeldia incana]|nr:hypothetical protein HA466_0196470 [Hirschfeldia incana]